MIGGDLRFEGFDARSWTNLLSLFVPGVIEHIEEEPAFTDDPGAEHPVADGPVRGTLFVVENDDGRILKAFHTSRGRVRDLASIDTADLAKLCHQHHAKRCVLLREGVLEELAERVALRMQRGNDYLTQWLVLLRALREMEEAALIRVWPRQLPNVPVPSPAAVRRVLDVVLPDGHALLLALWQGSALWTALVVRRRAGRIDLVAGPDLIARWAGPLGGDFRRDYRILSEAASQTVAPVHVGIFAQRDRFQALLRDPTAGAWARAVAVRDVIVHPAPPYVAVALGADAVRAVARRSARFLAEAELGPLTPVARGLHDRFSKMRSLGAILGLSPMQALGSALQADDEPVEP